MYDTEPSALPSIVNLIEVLKACWALALDVPEAIVEALPAIEEDELWETDNSAIALQSVATPARPATPTAVNIWLLANERERKKGNRRKKSR